MRVPSPFPSEHDKGLWAAIWIVLLIAIVCTILVFWDTRWLGVEFVALGLTWVLNTVARVRTNKRTEQATARLNAAMTDLFKTP